MSKVMTNKKLVEIALKIEKEPTTYYSVSGGAWCKWNGSKWNMDCVCMIKGILWGFNFNKNHAHGGANYGSNGVYDDNADGIMRRCTNISTDFSNIEVGEIVHMAGHVGIYIGNRQVVEATAAWSYKVQISQIGMDGRRSKNGSNCGYWQNHGKLQYVDYIKEDNPEPTPCKNYKVGDIIEINGVYVSSTSTEKLTPKIKKGTITKIVEARNPYLLDNGNIGWVNDDCIISQKIHYLSNTSYKGNSIVDALKQINVDTSFSYRSKLANKNNISNYSGTAEQNTKMLEMLKKGMLISI